MKNRGHVTVPEVETEGKLPSRGLSDREKEISALHIISELLNSDLDSDEIQARAIHEICNILSAETGALILLNDEDSNIAVKKIVGENGKWLNQLSLKVDDGLVTEIIKSGEPLRTNDIALTEGLKQEIDCINGVTIRSMLCAPLQVYENSLGVIQIFNKIGKDFDPYDQELLVAITTSIANAIYNTRLIQQLKVANADLEANRWELLRSRNTLRAFFDSTPTSIYIVDRAYTLIAINMSRARIVQQQPSQIVGKVCHKILFHREEPCPGCRVGETIFSGKDTQRIERRWETDGNPLEYEITTYPIHNEKGQIIQAFIFEEDVTEKRRLEATLVQSEKLAAVGQLAAGVAHEINNPLTAIIANAQLLKRMIQADEDIHEMLDLISTAGNRASQVVRNLLDFARKEHYDFEPTDVNDTITKSLALVQHELLSRSIELIFDPEDNLPPVLASNDHLQGVWLNLLLNAIDALDDDDGMIKVVTKSQAKEIMVTVTDNGKGIPHEQVSRIFEPFYTTKEPGRGTGLGLSVCHRTIKQHGGHLSVHSQVGSGTEFTVVLPIS
jgi:two-component system NtrC family sensor kinase